MPRDHRPPDPPPFDPLSARTLAVACALVGLGTILLSERPTPEGVLLAWGGLAGWALLRVFGGRPPQPARRKVRARPQPIIEILEVKDWEAKDWRAKDRGAKDWGAKDWAPQRPPPPLALPKPVAAAPPEAAWTTSAHPAVLAGVRRRREED